MATYAAYRHVELDKVGCGKRRITKPPGGETNDVFTSTPTSTPPTTPRKVKNHLASNIFSPDAPSAAFLQHKMRARNADDSFSKLFGANGYPDSPDGGSPRKNPLKSNIIFALGANGHVSNGLDDSGSSASSSGSVTPNGSLNGDAITKSNGHLNGGGTPEIMHRRIPPGGFSAKLW